MLQLQRRTRLHSIPSEFQVGHAAASLVPRPHPRGGKGSGELGQNPWACTEEFPRANEIVALAQSYDKLTAGMQHRYTYRVAIQFRRPIRFKVCLIAGCGHAITCKCSHSDQSEPSFSWPCRHICACAVEREPRIHPKFTRPFSSFWGWGLGTRLRCCSRRAGQPLVTVMCAIYSARLALFIHGIT